MSIKRVTISLPEDVVRSIQARRSRGDTINVSAICVEALRVELGIPEQETTKARLSALEAKVLELQDRITAHAAALAARAKGTSPTRKH